MGSLYRSEQMQLCQLIAHKDAAFACIAQLGKRRCVQFKDLNANVSAFQRRFVNDVRRCSELERRIRFLESQVKEAGIIMDAIDFEDVAVPSTRDVYNLEIQLSELEKDILQQNEIHAQMRLTLSEIMEFYYVVQKVDAFFEVHMEDDAMNELSAAELEETDDSALISLRAEPEIPWFIAGVLPQEKRSAFERVLWRACRRTAFVRDAEIEDVIQDPLTGIPARKCVFVVFFKGQSLKNIVNKVCEGFNANLYACPKTAKERHTAAIRAIARASDLRTVIATTQQQRISLLSALAKRLPLWQNQVYQQKAIYHTLNMCTYDPSGRFLIMECWMPKSHHKNVQEALDKAVEESGATVKPIIHIFEANEPPPTFFVTNKFTSVFQNIVDAYGVPSYREINPCPFTLITFPFLFAVMFGDCAHGLLLVISALFFILNERKIIAKQQHIDDEIFNTFFNGRYVILLMGLFSTYTGLIYNDMFAKSLNIFGSSWRNPYEASKLRSLVVESFESGKPLMMTFDPLTSYMKDGGPYPFGVDPVWSLAENRLTFLNSMKMKAAVIIGISQMTFGVMLSFLNYRFFKSRVDIITVFIPQIIFLSSVFIYLCLQIVVKWIFFSAEAGYVFGQYYPGAKCAPSLLIGFINMFMMKQRPKEFMSAGNEANITRQCYFYEWYPHQQCVERLLVCAALLCIPVMLFGKPLLALIKENTINHTRRGVIQTMRSRLDSEEIVLVESEMKREEQNQPVIDDAENISDLFIFQVIHMIEFVLGSVSHTASYLRLWALSLAHAQLSEVLWDMILAQSFASSGLIGVLMMYFCFAFFAILTFAILIIMEGLSAFLHALRLHWVEFQSKFYEGGGHSFVPFSLVDCLQRARCEADVTIKNNV